MIMTADRHRQSPAAEKTPLLHIDRLCIELKHSRQSKTNLPASTHVVGPLTLSLSAGECVGLIGESGAGKSLTALAIAGLLPAAMRMSGTIRFDTPQPSLPISASASRLNAAIVFQNARAALHPGRRIAALLADVLALTGIARRERAAHARDALRQVGIDDPDDCLRRYSFELSGGMCQRVLLALLLARRPCLLIADEPTAGLDLQARETVLDLLADTSREAHRAVLLITHDLPAAIARCDRIAVMRAGNIVEIIAAQDFLAKAEHPYSRALIAATPAFANTLADLQPLHSVNAVQASAFLPSVPHGEDNGLA